MSGFLDAHHLLAASAAILLLTALGPARVVAAAARAARHDAPLRATPAPLEPLVVRHAYLGRVAGLVLLSTIAFTLGDYVFKSAVAQAVAPADLGRFFASFYLGLNVLSILAQVLLSGWLMRTLGVSRALAVLPLLVLLSALGVAAGAGLMGALLLKITDGSLRPSLNRLGIELLFVPVPEAHRAAAKPAIDVLGARGGQALASVFILAALAAGGGSATVAVAVAVTCVACAGVALSLRPHYLNVFRSAVREGTLLEPTALPPLDLSSLEALFAALTSRRRRGGAGRARAPGEPGPRPARAGSAAPPSVEACRAAHADAARRRPSGPTGSRSRTGCFRAPTRRSARRPCARGPRLGPRSGPCARRPRMRARSCGPPRSWA